MVISDLCGSFVQDEVWQCREYSRRLGVPLWSPLLKYTNETSTKREYSKSLTFLANKHKRSGLSCYFMSPLSLSSDVSSLWSSSRIGAFLAQYLPFFWRAGATNQFRIGTSMMRSHSKGSAEHRSPSSRSMTCVILYHRRIVSETVFSLAIFTFT